VRVLTGEIVGILAHVERADQHATCALQALHQRGIGGSGRPVPVDLRARQRCKTRHVEQVLGGERHARQHSERTAGSALGIDGARPSKGPLAGDSRESVEGLVALADAPQGRRDDLRGADLARRNGLRDLGY
jgi:hypothetical protein